MDSHETWQLTIVILALIWVIMESLFLGRLKSNHEQVYTKLGSPSLYFNLRYKKLMPYLLSRRYLQLHDKQLTLLADMVVINMLLIFISIIIYVVVL